LVERTTNNFRFPGQYFIEETGLYYNWWRWYENEMGRYIQIDLLNKYKIQKYSFLFSRIVESIHLYILNYYNILFYYVKQTTNYNFLHATNVDLIAEGLIKVRTNMDSKRLHTYLYSNANPILYCDNSGLGVSGPWGTLPWFLEPPYCPFYQLATWIHCFFECRKEKCQPFAECSLNCVYEFYKGWNNPMYPLPDFQRL